MNTKLNTAASLMVVALVAGPVWAQDAGGAKTREQVRAELIEAQQRGEIPAGGDSNWVFPQPASVMAAGPGLTRAQVKADLLKAQRRGETITGWGSGSSWNYPNY
jgi:hypothetical protein